MEDLQGLLEKINREGVEKAEATAAKIVAEATAKADAIVKNARAEADKAKADAAKFETPILTFVILDGDEKSTMLKRFLLNNKMFKLFAQENFVTLILKGQKSAKDKKLVEKKSFKNWDFVEKHIMNADHKAVDDTADMVSKYPGAFFVTADGEKKLADLPKYDPELGFGAWAMELVAKLEAAGVSANVSAAVKKARENPQPDIKQPAAKKKK